MNTPHSAPRRTREECIAAAAGVVVQARKRRDSMTVADAARAAHRLGGPSIAELETLIRSLRTRQVAA